MAEATQAVMRGLDGTPSSALGTGECREPRCGCPRVQELGKQEE